MLGYLISHCSKVGLLFAVLSASAFIVDRQDKLGGQWANAFQKQRHAGIKLCRLSTEPSSSLGFSPSAAPVSMSVTGRVTPLAMGPVALVAILMVVCVVGIGKGKV